MVERLTEDVERTVTEEQTVAVVEDSSNENIIINDSGMVGIRNDDKRVDVFELVVALELYDSTDGEEVSHGDITVKSSSLTARDGRERIIVHIDTRSRGTTVERMNSLIHAAHSEGFLDFTHSDVEEFVEEMQQDSIVAEVEDIFPEYRFTVIDMTDDENASSDVAVELDEGWTHKTLETARDAGYYVNAVSDGSDYVANTDKTTIFLCKDE